MTAALKPLLTTAEVWKMLPGQGQGMMRRLIAARWIGPCIGGTRPIYRAADVAACLERLERGERPEPVHVWRTALGQDSAHLVDPQGRPVCNCRDREWMASMPSQRQCTRCQGAAKALRVEAA